MLLRPILAACALTIAGLVAAGPPVAAAGPAVAFDAPIDSSVGLSPFDVAVGDVDGDGSLDAVAVNFYSDSLTYLRGHGDGGFSPGVDFATGTEPVRVVVADVNGDNRADAIVANNRSGTVSVLIRWVTAPSSRRWTTTPVRHRAGWRSVTSTAITTPTCWSPA